MSLFVSVVALGLVLPQAAPRVSSYRDHARPLLIFAGPLGDPQLQQQLDVLAGHSGGLRERDVVLLVPGGQPVRPASLDPVVWPMQQPEDAATRRQFGIRPGVFTVILVGKDGSEKHRWNRPVPYETLRDLIDSMPMRQDEIRRTHQRP